MNEIFGVLIKPEANSPEILSDSLIKDKVVVWIATSRTLLLIAVDINFATEHLRSSYMFSCIAVILYLKTFTLLLSTFSVFDNNLNEHRLVD